MVHAKKSLGQHFLKDENVAGKIVECFLESNQAKTLLEIGPGTGVLTKYLLKEKTKTLFAVELDQRMIPLLIQQFPQLAHRIFNEDVLALDLKKLSGEPIAVIGNFPYNISSQILFKVLENKEYVATVVGMFQKEVAKRITAPAGSKEYGILSVLVQSFYNCDYLFDVDKKCFVPPPKVTSGVIRLVKKAHLPEIKNEARLFQLVKAGFGKRRKTLRNSLKEVIGNSDLTADEIFDKRAEQLQVQEWIGLANRLSESL